MHTHTHTHVCKHLYMYIYASTLQALSLMLNTLQRCRLSQTLLKEIFLPVTGIQLSGSLSVLHLLNFDFKAIELTVYSAMSRTLWDKWALVSGSLPVCK